jgi:hypothetical protein
MDIYYRVDGSEVINVEYQPTDSEEKVYDFFKSMWHLTSWVEFECQGANLIELTDDNYQELKDAGKVS